VLNEFFGPQLSNTSLVLLDLLTGRTLWAYWYIPFAMLLFLLSPVFIKYISLQLSTKIIITSSLFILSMFVQRPAWEINPIHSLIYYTPYYLLGIIYSMERFHINYWIKGKAILLLLVTTLVAMLMYLLGQMDSMGKASIWTWHGVDLMIFQKISLIVFMLAFTMQLQEYDIPFLKLTANMSFALFFLHQWGLSFMRRSGLMDIEHGFGGVLLIFIATTAFSYAMGYLIKRILGSKSRYVIGW
jgi:probable poly-beta-1,6-N-acetyl-D-glucosamine export protein